jgi:uncharacterized membrane protein
VISNNRLTRPEQREVPNGAALRAYTRVPIEVLVGGLTVAPFIVLAYFYPALPERIPVFLDFHGNVQVWAAKGILSVFRVPAMAVDLQILCLLMKYGAVQSGASLSAKNAAAYQQFQKRATALSVSLWEWLRCAVAFKMCAESLDITLLGRERQHFLKNAVWATPWLAALVGIVVALFYGFKILAVKNEMKKAGLADAKTPVAKEHLYRGFFYFNPDDPALFASGYLFNFANKWLYVFFLAIVAYPLLVLSTSL